MRDLRCLVVAVALMLSLSGCSGIEERCDLACKAASRCGVPRPSKDCTEYCVYHYEEDSSDKCQEEFDELTGCLGRNIEGDDEDLCYGCEAYYDYAYRACDWMTPPDNLMSLTLGETR